ncbi:MAG: hypothetical protein AAGA54_19915 [Myxococcota bacterium]
MQRINLLAAGFALAAAAGGCSSAPSQSPGDTDDAPVSESGDASAEGSDTTPDDDDNGDDSTGDAPGGLPSDAPTVIELLADSGFTDASAVAAAPDGSAFYFAAYDDGGAPGIFRVDLEGDVSALHVGAPLAYPSDVAVSCDGSQVLVSDIGGASSIEAAIDFDDAQEDFPGGIFALSPEGGAPQPYGVSGLGRAAGLIVSVDCQDLYISGYTEAGVPAVFVAPAEGGPASVLHEGSPLVSPTGIHVDENDVAWVMDHHARAESGAEGLLFAIDDTGSVSEVASGLGMGRHGGVSLAPGGVTAVIPVSDDLGGSRLITANTVDGDVALVPTSDILEPSGVAAARNAPVMVIAAETSIYLATYE